MFIQIKKIEAELNCFRYIKDTIINIFPNEPFT
jgi:hypothetical protein